MDTRADSSAKDFCQKLINKDQKARWSARQALEHPWLRGNTNSSGEYDLAANIRKNQAKANWKKAVHVSTEPASCLASHGLAAMAYADPR